MRNESNKGCIFTGIVCTVVYFILPFVMTMINLKEVIRELKEGIINDTLSELFGVSIIFHLVFAIGTPLVMFGESKNRLIAFWEKVLYGIFVNPIIMLYAALFSIIYILNVGRIQDHANSIYYFMVALICIIVVLLLIYHFNICKFYVLCLDI